MDGDLRFRLLGGLSARRVGSSGEVELDLGGPQPRRLLAALLLSLDQPLPPDRLIELVWGDAPPVSARGSLQAYVSNLRRALAPPGGDRRAPVVALRPGGYQLLVERSQLDTGRFEAAVTEGSRAAAEGRSADAAQHLTTALATWAPLLPELADVPFVRCEAVRLDARRATAFELLQTARLATGDHHDAIADLRAAVAVDPRAERLWALLALARYRSGHPSGAIATVHAARTALREAGLPLGPELRQLEADLFTQATELGAGVPSAQVAVTVVAEPVPAAHPVPAPSPDPSSARHRRCRRPAHAPAPLGGRRPRH